MLGECEPEKSSYTVKEMKLLFFRFAEKYTPHRQNVFCSYVWFAMIRFMISQKQAITHIGLKPSYEIQSVLSNLTRRAQANTRSGCATRWTLNPNIRTQTTLNVSYCYYRWFSLRRQKHKKQIHLWLYKIGFKPNEVSKESCQGGP